MNNTIEQQLQNLSKNKCGKSVLDVFKLAESYCNHTIPFTEKFISDIVVGDLVFYQKCPINKYVFHNGRQFISVEPNKGYLLVSMTKKIRSSGRLIFDWEFNVLVDSQLMICLEPEFLFFLQHGNCLTGKSVSFTGSLKNVREYYANVVQFQGGSYKKSVNRGLDYLVYGQSVGKTKMDKAKNLGVKTINEKEFYELIQTNH